MKISKADLQGTLNNVTRAVAARTTMPVLSHIVFDGGTHRIFGTDLETWIIQDVPDLDFSACVPARLLVDLVNTMTGMITLEVRDNAVIVSSGKNESTVRTLAFEEAPELVNPPTDWQGVEAARFLKDIDRVALCAATEESRPILMGVLISPEFTLSAADGFRLATTGPSDAGVIIPAKTLSLLPKALDGDGEIQCAFSDTQAAFRAGSVTVISQVISGNFPQVSAIIPKAHSAIISFVAGEALYALKPIMALHKNERGDNQVTIERAGEYIKLSAQTTMGEASGEFFASGGEFEPFAVNGKYLKDALAVMDKIEMKLTTPSSPVLLQEGDYQHVIMPMQVRNYSAGG